MTSGFAPLPRARPRPGKNWPPVGSEGPTAGGGGGAYDSAVVGTAEGDLVRAACQGDQRAWDALVARYSGLVWSIARAHRFDGADAADVSQTAWLRLVENLSRIREPDRVGAWLAATTRHECLRVLRRSGRQLPTVLDTDEEPLPAEAPQVDEGLLAGERNEELWQAFAAINPRCQELLRLLISDPPLSYDEIAATLDMAVGSIGPTRARCLEHLRRKARITGAVDGS